MQIDNKNIKIIITQLHGGPVALLVLIDCKRRLYQGDDYEDVDHKWPQP